MTQEDIRELQLKYIQLKNSGCIDDLNEANTSKKLVVPFLIKSGFNEENLFFEEAVVRGKAIADISVKINGKVLMYIEVKKASIDNIDIRDLHQITSYLNSKEIEWGILTNGKDYILVNNNIKGKYDDKAILDYNIFNIYYKEIYDNFTYDYLFGSKFSIYYKILKQYKIFKLQENKNYNTWSRYNDTIQKYFMYIKEKNDVFKDPKYLSHNDFMIFNKEDLKKGIINSVKTVKNRYYHIKDFYELFDKHNLLSDNPFKFNISDDELCEIYGLRNVEEASPLTIDEIKYILDSYKNTREPERNRIMLLLCLYCGANREDLANLKIGDIDIDNKTIKFEDNIFELPEQLIIRIDNYIQNIRSKEYNSDYLFAHKYEGYTENPMAIGNVNKIIKNATSYLKQNQNMRHIQINLEKINGMLIKKLYEAGFSLEEIIAISGISLGSLPKYISTESILEKTEVKLLDKRHPYLEIFKIFTTENSTQDKNF